MTNVSLWWDAGIEPKPWILPVSGYFFSHLAIQKGTGFRLDLRLGKNDLTEGLNLAGSISSRAPFDLRTNRSQLLFDPLIAAIDVIHALNRRLPLRHQAR